MLIYISHIYSHYLIGLKKVYNYIAQLLHHFLTILALSLKNDPKLLICVILYSGTPLLRTP